MLLTMDVGNTNITAGIFVEKDSGGTVSYHNETSENFR